MCVGKTRKGFSLLVAVALKEFIFLVTIPYLVPYLKDGMGVVVEVGMGGWELSPRSFHGLVAFCDAPVS